MAFSAGVFYRKLNIPKAPPESIRLCSVQSDLESDPPQVDCNVWITELHNAPKYSALSYTWLSPLYRSQDEEPEHEITCNGSDKMPVYSNIFHALLRLGQPPYRGKAFWIDRICIHQDDQEERSHQVNMMSEIYKRAEEVVIWLGPDDQYLSSAIELIIGLARLSDQQRRLITPQSIELPTSRAFLKPNLNEKSSWLSLAHFFRRRWFSRAWVIQEVLLARATIVLCGRCHTLSWNDLVDVSDYLSTSVWRLAFRDPEYLGFNDILPKYNAPTNLRAAKRDLAVKSQFLRCLIRAREHDCAEPIDKVFCLYGIAQIHTPPGIVIPKANYNHSVQQAFIEATINVLQSSVDLHVLAYVEGRKHQKVQNLPSWVPDWNVKEQIGIGKTGHERYWAAGQMPKSTLEFPRPSVLRLSAAKLCDITICGESKQEVSRNGLFPGWLRLLDSFNGKYYTGQPLLEVFWRILVYDTSATGTFPAPREVGDSFYPWFIQRLKTNTQNWENYIVAAEQADLTLHSSVESDKQSEGSAEHTLVNHKHDASLFNFCFHFRKYLRPFRTLEGILGLASDSAEPGDSVWIVPGSRIPLILRKRPENDSRSQRHRYELVGGCYLHGFMHGQALEQGVPAANEYRAINFETVELE